MEIVYRLDPRFNDARKIANARFNWNPAVIYFCEKTEDVQQAISDAKTQGLYVRVRSGGHHHEGMCSGPNILMIDVSRIKRCDVEGVTVRVGPGARLKDVYSTLWKAGKHFPGGGCGDVCVGGLVQGGGWGPYGRMLGLTCDNLTWFRMVKADGTILEVSNDPKDQYADLFRAVCGGGGGNFGVITEFVFKVAPKTTPIWSFTAKWKDPAWVKPVIEDWRTHFPLDSDVRLTSFARLSAVKGDSPDYPAIVAGFFIGSREEIERIPARLLPNTWRAAEQPIKIDQVDKMTAEGVCAFQHPDYQPGPPAAAVRALSAFGEAPPGDLSETCTGAFFPHKISSCFPRETFGPDAVSAIVDYLAGSAASSTDRRYLSLHSLGGAYGTANSRSCFAFRGKRFMLQYQAWWADVENYPLQLDCLKWITQFREAMKDYTEGAFINFPDRDLVQAEYPNQPSRKDLLRIYYQGYLEELIAIKAKYDRDNFFDFEMGIPTS